RTDASDEGRLDHVAAQTRVFADHDLGRPFAGFGSHQCDRLTESHHEFGRHRVNVGLAANAVGSEQTALFGGVGGQIGHAWVQSRKLTNCKSSSKSCAFKSAI